MNRRFSILAAAFGAAAVVSLPSSATASGGINTMPVAGARLERTVNLEQDAVGSDGKSLPKGTYELKIESLGNGKVKVSFFKGGVRKGEANGIVVLGGAQAAGVVKPKGPGPGGAARATSFADLGLDATSRAACFPPIGTIGAAGGNQIRIDLLVPAVQKGILGPNNMPGQKVQPDAGAHKVQPVK